MRYLINLVCSLAIALHTLHAAPASSKSDAELSRQLSGSWENGAPRGIMTFYRDGTFRGFVTTQFKSLTLARIDIKGSWRIEDGVLTGNISSSSAPSVFPPGKMKTVRIISISSTELVAQDAKGRRERLPKVRIPSVLPPLLSSDIRLFLGGRKAPKSVIKSSILERSEPSYPKAARHDRKSGSGAFGLIVDKSTGKVQSVRTLISTGSELLDTAARDALARWRFKPDSVDKLVVPVDFRLSQGGPLGIFGL